MMTDPNIVIAIEKLIEQVVDNSLSIKATALLVAVGLILIVVTIILSKH